ncbi:MAG: DUF4861 family protein [Terracidiphilus sp.]|nr:DUF4861 family protein [Terracidiphilus sp.]
MINEIIFATVRFSATAIGLILAALPSLVAAQKNAQWLLPNFSDRLEMRVTNTADRPVATLALISVEAATRVAPGFPGSLAIVVLRSNTMTVLPSQADDLDGDGRPDEFVFPVQLPARASAEVEIYYSSVLHDVLPWPRRVFASHAYGYNHATAALESEQIGYRTYGGFFLDAQARRQGHPGLNNALAGYLSIAASDPSPAGRDIFHVGDTLGLGGLFLKAQGELFRPPVNVPDYAHRREPVEVPHYRVIADGPVRAMIEARMDRWTLGGDAVRIRAVYSIAAESEAVECRFQIEPLSLSRSYEVGAGIRHLPKMQSDVQPGRLALSGEQDATIGPLGLALYYETQTASTAGVIATPEDGNDIILYHKRLEPNQAVAGRYWLAADWSGSGIPHLLEHLRQVESQARATVAVDQFRHSVTPAPERLEGEAY